MMVDLKTLKPIDPTQQLLPHNFYALGRDFRDAYRKSPAGNPPDRPRYFLFCHAIELALKAFLALHGLTQDELAQKPYGHDLEALMNKAVQLGLRFDRHDTASQLLLLNQAHTEYWPRYPMKTANPVFVISEFEPNGMTCSSLF